MSEDRNAGPADERPRHSDDAAASGSRGHSEGADEQPPGTSWAVGGQDRRRPQGAAHGPDGAYGGDRDDFGRDDFGGDDFGPGAAFDPAGEEALRRLLHDAADGLNPRPGALDEIRQAIPARRARRRHMLVGAGAAALVVGVTLPLMQAGVVPGPLNNESSSNAAQSQPSDSADSDERDGSVSGGQEGSDQDSGDTGGSGDAERDDRSDAPSDPNSSSPDGDSQISNAPTCGPDQLGEGDVEVGDPDSKGRIYGSFELSNVSDQTCRVRGRDGLTASGVGRVPTAGVQVLDHTPGGRASALPDPSQQNGPVILRPGETYEVKFAWIPSPEGGQACVPKDEEPDPSEPPPGGPGGGSGDPGSGGNEGGDGDNEGGDGDNEGGDGDDGMNPQANGGSGGDQDGSAVVLNYKPAAGEPRLPAAYLDSACPGTVYRTGPMRTS